MEGDSEIQKLGFCGSLWIHSIEWDYQQHKGNLLQNLSNKQIKIVVEWTYMTDGSCDDLLNFHDVGYVFFLSLLGDKKREILDTLIEGNLKV